MWKVFTPLVFCSLVLIQPTSSGVIKRSSSRDIAADLFKPLDAETEKPLKFAAVPTPTPLLPFIATSSAASSNLQYDLKENYFYENSGSSGKIKKSDGDGHAAVFEELGDALEQNSETKNTEKLYNITLTDPHEIAPLLEQLKREFPHLEDTAFVIGEIARNFFSKNADNVTTGLSSVEPKRHGRITKPSDGSFRMWNTDDMVSKALLNNDVVKRILATTNKNEDIQPNTKHFRNEDDVNIKILARPESKNKEGFTVHRRNNRTFEATDNKEEVSITILPRTKSTQIVSLKE